MYGLITDRTQQNVSRRAALSSKGFGGMTLAERAEWFGDPLTTTGANLMPYGSNYSGTVDLKYTSSAITAKALTAGIYLYGVSIIGDAVNYENTKFTLSLNGIENLGGGTPMISLYWHDGNGFDYAGASLLGAGSMTFDTTNFPNTNNRDNLALYVYVTQNESVTVGATVKFVGVMLEKGSVRHSYVPYTEVVATPTTKGAYNYSDLNRVERAVAEIADLVGLSLVTKTNWTMWDIPTSLDMSRYLNNIKTIRSYVGSNIALPNTMDNLNYTYANNIEEILLAAYNISLARTGGV